MQTKITWMFTRPLTAYGVMATFDYTMGLSGIR